MFSTLKSRIILGVYIFLILSIPVGAYLASQQTIFKSSANEASSSATIRTILPPTLNPKDELIANSSSSAKVSKSTPSPTPAADETDVTIPTTFGPTLSFKVSLEGRPTNNQTAKIFIGIATGSPTTNPTYLLSFTVDLPSSGAFSGLSLAGLTAGDTYTAYIKGPAQIATSSAFVMNSAVSNLNSGESVTLLTGDLNDDNIINSADFTILRNVYGSTPASENWNANADFNLDSVVNTYDLAYIIKNMGQTGNSGTWVSTPVASSSGGITPQGSPSSGGYWIWVPK